MMGGPVQPTIIGHLLYRSSVHAACAGFKTNRYESSGGEEDQVN